MRLYEAPLNVCCSALVLTSFPLIVQLIIIYILLQHLVRFRWDEFSISERREFANYTINLVVEVVGSHEEWALKSQMAALVAEVLAFLIIFRLG